MEYPLDLVVAGNLAQDIIYDTSYYGGSAGNIAINASFFGIRAAVLSNRGEDSFSTQYLTYLEQLGVSTEFINPGLHKLAQCIVSNSFNHSSSKQWHDNGSTEALQNYALNDIQRANLAHASAIHLTTVPDQLAKMLLNTVGDNTIIGYEPGPMILRDISYFSREVFSRSDYLFINEEERAVLDTTIGMATLRSLMNSSQGIITTLGEKGCTLTTLNDDRAVESSYRITGSHLIDSNGAGDAFRSGFYSVLLRGGLMTEALQTANDFGAAIVQQSGAILNDNSIKRLTPHDELTA